jgi:ParB-like chromosome segregation protein Spo0J
MGRKKKTHNKIDGYWMHPNEIIIVGVDVPASDDLSLLYDPNVENEVDPSMVANIKVYGIAEPVIVTMIDDRAHVVDGRDRVRAGRIALEELIAEGKEEIRVPVVLRDGEDHELFGVMISSNEIRRSENIIARAKKVLRFLNMGRSREEAAIAFGVSEGLVRNWIKIARLAKPVQKLIENGDLSANAAISLCDLNSKEQVAKALEIVREAKSTGKRPTAKRINKALTGRPMAPGKKTIKNILLVEKELPGVVAPKIKPEHDNFFSALRYIIGDISASDIGLNIKAIEKESKRIKEEMKKVYAAQYRADRAAEKAEKARKEAEAAERRKKSSDAIRRGTVVVKKKGRPAA